MHMSTILLVEDYPILSETLLYNLEREGYAVINAPDGVVGLERARRDQPDMVILDVMLPRLDGFSAVAFCARRAKSPS